jgi:hypothetical protein
MKASIAGSVVLAAVIACSVSLVAQDKPAAAQDKPAAAQDKPAAKEHSMTGCVQKGSSADTFVMSNTEPKGPKTIGIVESKENLAPHVGHKMTITGVDVPAKEVESGKKKVDKAEHYMKISSFKMVSATCP